MVLNKISEPQNFTFGLENGRKLLNEGFSGKRKEKKLSLGRC